MRLSEIRKQIRVYNKSMLHHYNKLHFRPLTGQVPGYQSAQNLIKIQASALLPSGFKTNCTTIIFWIRCIFLIMISSTIFSLAYSVLALRDCLEWKSPMKMLSDVGCKFVFIAFFHTNSPHSDCLMDMPQSLFLLCHSCILSVQAADAEFQIR